MESKVARRTAAPAMGRGVRTARGAAISIAATLLAATSHALAGGQVTVFSVFATAVFALPLTMALVGRKPALWRLTIAVSVAQLVYHWCFAGLGLFSERGNLSAPAPLHAMHLAQLESFVPDLATAATASAAMWLSHAAAAVLTIALLYRGEVAYRLLAQIIRRVLPRLRFAVVAVPRPISILPVIRVLASPQLAQLTPISHRGPPAVSFTYSI
ncbi:hypothetical protein [Leucobacter salsicius]|uniref:hypothetical protein n=1 Tax=Leucobacter salsicius TaxID=664638 RepID=UPI00034A001F|nr:hypothetical protein [Leucobacter salsicius]